MSELMEVVAELKQQYKKIDPILVIAPVQRCGTTLLQRAINSGGEAIIYGENFFMLEMHPRNIGAPVSGYDDKIKITASNTEAFLSGKKDIDATGLFPDYEEYTRIVLETFYTILEQYQTYSKDNKYKHWGLKHQPVDITGLSNFFSMVPSCRIILIYRDLVDVAKSFKARWPEQMQTDEQVAKFGLRWANHLNFLMSLSNDKLVVKYEDMIADKKKYVANIQDHLKVAVSLEEFDKKINAHYTQEDIEKADIKDRKKGGTYIEPAEISDTEKELLIASTKGFYQQAGY